MSTLGGCWSTLGLVFAQVRMRESTYANPAHPNSPKGPAMNKSRSPLKVTAMVAAELAAVSAIILGSGALAFAQGDTAAGGSYYPVHAVQSSQTR